ncbi:MAG TPA: hypothetical protein VIW67_01920, partial [Terriglobales bacterium]
MRSEVVKGLVQSLERLRGGQGIKGAHLPTFYYSNGRLMKTSLLAVLFGALTITAVSAQPAPSARPRPGPAPLIDGQRTGDSREWLKVETITDESGRPVTRTRRAFVELATGMSYWDGQQWMESESTFDTTSDGFAATRMQHKVRLAANIKQLGAVTLTTPDGITLRSTPIGIGLYDAASGRSLIIGETADSYGTLVDSNRVVYPNAFKGVCADVVYTIHNHSFEQDVVITGKLNPADYGFPTNTTRIQIFSEFYGKTPEPERTRRPLKVEQDKEARGKMASPDLVDESLAFGKMVFGAGRAARYATLMSDSAAAAAPVAKEFLTAEDGRTVLIESVQYSWIAKDLMSLPDCQIAALKKEPGSKIPKTGYAQLPSPIRPADVSAETRKPQEAITVTELESRPGVAVDYIATLGATAPTVFQGDTTYLVTGTVNCNGPTTIEGGAVFKFKYTTTAVASIYINSSVTCKTSRYRPAIFTCVDDDSVGETMNGYPNSGYTGNFNANGYANPAIQINGNSGTVLSNLRFTRCKEAVRLVGADGMF